MRKLNRNQLEKLLTSRLEADLETCRVSGAHLLVTQGGKTVVDICRGWQNPMTGDSLFSSPSL